MVKFIKPGKVFIVTRGRHAGQKVVLVQINDQGSKQHAFPHAIVAGVERAPLKVTKRMGEARTKRRVNLKPFVKIVNFNHLMPTRYSFELENLKTALNLDTFKEPSQKEAAVATFKQAFMERHSAGKNPWFFQKLRF